jgi:hypothetical protein
MERLQPITAKSILQACRFNWVPDIPPTILSSLQTPTAVEISGTIRRRLAQAPDAGVWKRIAAVLLEPPNPFDPKAHRQLKHGTAVLALLILAAVGLALYFNITAVTR